MSEKAKLIRGDPPKIDFKKKGEPPKKGEKASIVKAYSTERVRGRNKKQRDQTQLK